MRTAIALVAAAALSGLAACSPGPAADDTVEATAADDTVAVEADAVDAAAEDASATELIYTGDDDSGVTATATKDDSYRIEEDGRTYYYRRGEEDPYLVRENGRTYGFRNGRLESAVDAQGRSLSQSDRQSVANSASGWVERGRQLKSEVQPRQTGGGSTTATSGSRDQRDTGNDRDDKATTSSEPTRATTTGERRTSTDRKDATPDRETTQQDSAGARRDRGEQSTSRDNDEGRRQ